MNTAYLAFIPSLCLLLPLIYIWIRCISASLKKKYKSEETNQELLKVLFFKYA